MSSGEPRDEGGGGLLESVFAPLRLPERVMRALDEVAVSIRDLAPMREELGRIREQTAPLDDHLVDLHKDLEPIGERLTAVERSVDQMRDEVHAMREVIDEVKFDIQRVTGLRGERGLLERARDKVTGGAPNDRADDRTEGDGPEDTKD